MTDLYRFYDADNRLLYVGISLHAAQRASEHRRDKHWWPDVGRMDVEHLSDRQSAQAAELDAIRDEQPIYNIIGNRVSQPVPTLIWICAICDEPIDDRTGYVELPNSENLRFKREMAAHRARYPEQPRQGFQLISTKELLDLPTRAHWWALHRACDPVPDGGGYWFDIERVRTTYQVINWTAHLMGKNWLKETDWASLLERVQPETPIYTNHSIRRLKSETT